MTTTHYTPEQLPATTVDSGVSSPRSDHLDNNNPRVYDDNIAQARVRFMCSFGGKILPRPHDNQLRYVGGDTRIVSVLRHNTSFSSLLNKLSKLSGTPDICVKYQLPNEDLDALITVTSDEDVENMLDEYDRLANNNKNARLRIFLFPTDTSLSRGSSISSLLDGSIKREHWFLDALNGGASLERGRSEVSSIVSEVPDYLFGLDQPDDPKPKPKHLVSDNVSNSDPGSPAPRISSPYCSTSSSLAPPMAPSVPNLRPVRTKLDNPAPVVSEAKETVTTEHFAETNSPVIMKQSDYPGQPVYYVRRTSSPVPTQEMPFYYMHPPGSMPQENIPMQSAPIRGQYGQQYMGPPGQMLHPQVPNMAQVYSGLRPVSGGESYDMPVRTGSGPGQPMYYGPRYVNVPGYPPGMVLQGAEEMKQLGPDAKLGRAPQ
ncbi:Phox/Bem1p [Artemisia annua]|uniref:Phox/Bem1p n=1 Tax=Artemisia annua TaxID=35608 RepID=A0A2U1PNB3_ARTAN|nr:Phox/Bem1p [Artemisia annua]